MPIYDQATGTSINVDDFDASFTVRIAMPYVEVIPVFVVAGAIGGEVPGEPVGGFDGGFGPGFEGGS